MLSNVGPATREYEATYRPFTGHSRGQDRADHDLAVMIGAIS
jgi:hypothetical protein